MHSSSDKGPLRSPNFDRRSSLYQAFGPGLTSLSTELLYEICTFLSPKFESVQLGRDSFLDSLQCNAALESLQYKTSPSSNIRNLRLTCHYLNHVVEPILFNFLTFDFHVTRPNSSDFHHQLSSLASHTSPTRFHTKRLFIRCFNPLQSDHHHGTSSWNGRQFEKSDPAIHARAGRIQNSLDLHLIEAISSMKNLRSVKWDIVNDNQTTNVMQTLLLLPHLEDVYLDFNNYDFVSFETLGINRFTKLRRLGISCRGYISIKEDFIFPDQIAQLIRENSHLSHLQLVGPPFNVDRFCFHNLTRMVPIHQPLRMESLRLSNADLGDESIRHLQSLSSLFLWHMDSSVSNFDDIDTQKVDNAMEALRKGGISLKSLYVDHLSESIFKYLASFSGLKCLFLGHEYGSSNVQLYNPSHCLDLFQHILPLHSQTLKSLFLKARSSTSGLLFNENTANPFKACPNLTRCGITLGLSDDGSKCLTTLLESITAARVQLDILNIWYSDFHNPPVGCLNGYYSFEEKVGRVVRIWVESLVLTDPHLCPKEIHLPGISPMGSLSFQLNDLYKLVPSPDIPGRYVYRIPEDIQMKGHSEYTDGCDSDDDFNDEYNNESSKDVEEHIRRTCIYY